MRGDSDERAIKPWYAAATLPAGRTRAAAFAFEARASETRRAYRAACGCPDAMLAGRPLSDAALAEYVFCLAADGLDCSGRRSRRFPR